MENGLLRVKALLEGTGSIPVYITLDAYRQILKEKERFNCSVSEAYSQDNPAESSADDG